MNTLPSDLLFETIEEAQKVLDVKDPGYRIYIGVNEDAVVLDTNGSIAMFISPNGSTKRII